MEEIIETLAACNRTSVTLSIDHNVLEDLRAQFVAENVQITPPKMVFTDAFDGKQFRKSFTIINSGKYPVFIRIFPPTSQVISFSSYFLEKSIFL